MRSISANGLAKLATKQGTEPVIIIDVEWVEGGSVKRYGDKDVTSGRVDGKILSVSGLDNVITVSGVTQGTTGESQQLSFVLDDTDGAIKAILDAHDIHKRNVWVYQWFEGLDFDDRFLLFKGQVSSPIEWNEGDRTVSFDVINKIEDAEVGFSIEEGNFPYAPESLIGKPWPLVFGTCVHIPALQLQSPFEGILQTGFGVHDFTLQGRLNQLEKMCCPLVFSHQEWVIRGGGTQATFTNIFRPEPGCVCKIRNLRLEWIAELELQRSYELPEIEIIRGEIFPQGVMITLDICGARVTGKFNGTASSPSNTFVVNKYEHPRFQDYTIPPIVNYNCVHASSANWGGPTTQEPVPPSTAINCDAPAEDQDRAELGWDYLATFPNADFFWAEPGCRVFLVETDEIVYVANLLPSTILRVAAYRTFDTGARALVTVPPSLYTTRVTDFNGYMVTEIVFDRYLSRRGEGWEDQLYISQESSVGPNTVDILEWLIEKYTDFNIDTASFDDVRTKIDNYPSNFPLLERRNIIDVLKEIAFQARCALILRNDTFYIIYLSEEPDSDFTITEEDVIAKSFVLTHTETEELVTKFVAEWIEDYASEEKNKVILRYNIKRYGTQEQVFNFYIYNILELVQKSATFWLIRMANTWRKIRCRTPLTKLQAEVFDIATVTLPDFSPNNVKCIVEKATYDSDNHEIEFELWTPVRSGEQTAFDFAWPAYIDVTLLWPNREDLLAGIAGGSGPNVDVEAPAGHILGPTPPEDFNVTVEDLTCTPNEYSNDILGKCRKDHGDKKPTDLDDTKPEKRVPGGGETDIPTSKNPIGDKSNTVKLIEQNIAEGKADSSANTAASGAGGQGAPGTTDDPFENTPEEPEEGECSVAVEYRMYSTVNSVITGSGISTTPGETGPIASSPPPSGGGDEDKVVLYFDSLDTANAVAAELMSRQHADATVGEPHLVAGTVNTLLTNWNATECEPGDGTLIALNKPSNTDLDYAPFVEDVLSEVS